MNDQLILTSKILGEILNFDFVTDAPWLGLYKVGPEGNIAGANNWLAVAKKSD